MRVPLPFSGARPGRGTADLALAVLAVVSISLATAQIEPEGGERALDILGYACVVVAGGALAARRRAPAAVVGVVTAALVVYVARGYTGGPVFVTAWLALYSLACSRDRRQAVGAAVAVSALLVAVGAVAGTGHGLVHLLFVGWAAAAVFLGDARRTRLAHLAALEERARQLEQSREDEARRRVVEERLRIARDLHDSVAHSMATINVQAGAAAHVIERQPAQAKEALGVIQQASGEVLDELVALLGLLRLDPGEQPERAPTPGPDQLDDLVAATRRAGLPVTLRVERALDDLSQPVGVALYRIVQESLTNVLRHAGAPGSVTVTVTGDGTGGLGVEVADDGLPAGATLGGAGVGIVGMRERAESTGGRLEAGPRDGGGYVVRATWPASP